MSSSMYDALIKTEKGRDDIFDPDVDAIDLRMLTNY